jgi:hypothetical protein
MSKLIDMQGKTFGYWYVLERAENTKGGQARWLCKCTACGKEKVVDGGHLRRGDSTNCGCIGMKSFFKSSIKDETGKTYGYLYVERQATEEEKPRHDRTGVYWNCTCTRCNRKNIIVFGDYLRNGDTKSCGCIVSFNESKINELLKNACVKYTQQKTFNDLTLTGRKCDRLLFDFAIYNNSQLSYLIEYDGSQHFYSKNNGWNNKEHLKQVHKRDLAKNRYCFENNIPLIRIPYDVDYTIEDLILETTRFLLTPENEKEYYTSRKKTDFN